MATDHCHNLFKPVFASPLHPNHPLDPLKRWISSNAFVSLSDNRKPKLARRVMVVSSFQFPRCFEVTMIADDSATNKNIWHVIHSPYVGDCKQILLHERTQEKEVCLRPTQKLFAPCLLGHVFPSHNVDREEERKRETSPCGIQKSLCRLSVCTEGCICDSRCIQNA